MQLPGKVRELWEGMEENRRITLGMIADLPEDAFVRRDEGSWSIAEILELAASTREVTRASIGMLAGADPRSVEFPHPFFGSMNLYEWPCWIILEHEREHHPQIREIVRKLGTR